MRGTLARRLGRLQIRWRLALASAGLTFAILLLFAVVIGANTEARLRSDFDSQLRATAADLETRIPVSQSSPLGPPEILQSDVVDAVVDVAATGDAAMRIVEPGGQVTPPGAPDLGPPRPGVSEVNGYRVVSRPLLAPDSPTPAAFLQYGRDEASLSATIRRVRLFLGLGVLGGTALALLAGLAVARRAMGPIADLTRAAKQIAGTGDPAVRMPQPRADDEVADLARTLEEMLRSLDAARRETETTLDREREFVADASHELRTPLTSVLANLELLEAELAGDDREMARSALRSTQRMRRLVGDLLFLARADARRPSPATLAPVDLRAVVREAVAETAPLARTHEISADAPEAAVVEGSPDDLHRLVLNLVQNAVAHTPPGTRVTASLRGTGTAEGPKVTFEVMDDGPGIPPEMRERAFERFVRGVPAGAMGGSPAGSHGGRGSGLGLSIVRAVADAHGGTVAVGDAPGGGARFTVTLPAARISTESRERQQRLRAAEDPAQTSTTTGSTSGLRRSRS
jgi:two-component system OmpR family sensor kinase